MKRKLFQPVWGWLTKNIRNRLLVSSIALCVLFLAAEAAFSSLSMKRLLTEYYCEQNQASMNRMQDSLNNTMEMLELNAQALMADDAFMEKLTSAFTPTDYRSIYDSITFLDAAILNRYRDFSEIGRFLLAGRNQFAMDSNLLYQGKYIGDRFSYEELCDELEALGYQSPQTGPLLVEAGSDSGVSGSGAWLAKELDNEIILCRELTDAKQNPAGFLILVLEPEFFSDIFRSALEGQSTFVLDQNSRLLWTDSDRKEVFLTGGSTDSYAVIDTFDGEEIQTVHSLDSFGLTVYSRYPMPLVLQTSFSTFLIRILFCLLLLLCIIPVSFFFSARLSRPLNLLSEKLQQDLEAFRQEDFEQIWKPQYSLRAKIIFYYTITVFLPGFLFVCLITAQNYRKYYAAAERYIQSSVSQTEENLEKVLDGFEQISLNLSYTLVDIDNLIDENDFSELETEFYNLRFSQPNLLGIGIIDNHGGIVYETSHNTGLMSGAAQSVPELLQESDGRLTFVETRKVVSSNPVFVFARTLRSLNTFRRIGYSVCFVDSRAFTSLLDNTGLTDKGRYLLLDKNDRILLSDDTMTETLFETGIPDSLSGSPSGSFTIQANGEKYMVIFDRTSDADLFVAALIPLSEIRSQVFGQLGVSIALLFIIILLIICIGWLLSLSFTTPLKELQQKMTAASYGNLDIFMPCTGKDEISVVAGYFNEMIARLKELIEKNYQAELRQKELLYLEKEAQLNALQQQINPHFLYNTLESIKWMAYMNGCQEICDMATALGKFFRYAITKQRTLVPLEDELENLKNYLFIQKIRYEDKFNVILDVPSELLPYKVEKLIFQPIVENAIIHGIEHMKTGGLITIRGARTGNYLCFSISDNGAGMTKEQLDALRQRFRTDGKEESGGSVGIVNVYKRLSLYYQDDIAFEIKSAPGQGTVVSFRIPVSAKQDAGELPLQAT